MSTGEAFQFIRQERKKREAVDPVHWFVLTAPDGSTMGDVHELHESQCRQWNDSRMAAYLAGEMRRNRAREAWMAKCADAVGMHATLQREQLKVAEQMRGAEIPIPENSAVSRQLVAERKAQPLPPLPDPVLDPEPAIVYTSADYLWTRVKDARGKIIRVEGTRIGRHD